jgi:SNF2 family DNA or RNA helicase
VIGLHLRGFFDYGIADEVHELKGAETAQGNALGTLASACERTIILTGTLLGGYADELFAILFRLTLG